MGSEVEERNPVGPAQRMDVLETIRTRRSIGKVGPERPPREVIQRLLQAAVWAPNHHKTEPWRFYVLAGNARVVLGEVMARSQARRRSSPLKESKLEKIRRKPLRAPVVIAVAVEPSSDPDVVEIEEILATAAAVQNLLLTAHAMDLGAMWRTGDACYDPEVEAFFGLSEKARLLGFVYVGYPAMAAPRATRRPTEELTEWRGWEDNSDESR